MRVAYADGPFSVGAAYTDNARKTASSNHNQQSSVNVFGSFDPEFHFAFLIN